MSNRDDISFRIANSEDFDQIKLDISSFLSNNHYDLKQLKANKNYIFIGLKKNKIIHYFLTYENPIDSPLCTRVMPFNRSLLEKEDVYLGSTFTIPIERGNWIAPSSLSFIIEYYKSKTSKNRMFVLVHKNTPGAREYYERLGFNIIPNAAPKNVLQWILNKIKL